MTSPFRQYYRAAPLDLGCLTDLPHRHFRLFLPGGRFLKIDERIRDEARLRRWLLRYAPHDVYYSVSCWLNPERLGSRYGTPLTDNIFLAADLVFDIDRSPFTMRNLEEAKQDTLQLLAYLHAHDYAIRYCAFSGSKGFHVVASDPERYRCPSPYDREDRAKEARARLLDQVTAEGIVVDRKVSLDTRRILRLPGTINSKTGYACTILDETRLGRPVREILKAIPRISLSAPRIPFAGDDTPLRGSGIIPWLLNRLGVRLGASRFSYASYVTSRVPGIRRLVPFFEYPAGMGIERVQKILREVQTDYSLPDIYLFSSASGISALSLGTQQYRRIVKIIRASGSRDYSALLKYQCQHFRVGDRRDSTGTLVESAPIYVRTLPGGEDEGMQPVSRPHADLLSRFSVPLRAYPHTHGAGDLVMTHTIREH